jgi:uncharacterized protein YktA (UPF0223 family)|tara:strand:- start:22 stop:366 length:345 start_codon:yes stop_codon:yes gene_type:complete
MFDKSNQNSQYILEQIMKLIKNFSETLDTLDGKVDGVIHGRNKIQRGYSAYEAKGVIKKQKAEFRALKNIVVAKEQGKDIHRDELKSDKLEITGGRYGDLAQAIVDEEDSSNEN